MKNAKNSMKVIIYIFLQVNLNESSIEAVECHSTEVSLSEAVLRDQEVAENELVEEETSSKTPVNDENGEQKKYIRKPDFCWYCETNVLNFSRHIQRNHTHEFEVQKIFAKPRKSKERRELFSSLRKQGNFLKSQSGEAKPVKTPNLPNTTFLPCVHCLGLYASKQLFRHRKKCPKTQKKLKLHCQIHRAN